MQAKGTALPTISKPVFHFLTQRLTITFTKWFAKGDCKMCITQSILMRLTTDADDFLVHLQLVDLDLVDVFDLQLCIWQWVSGTPQFCNWCIVWSTLVHYSQNLIHAIYYDICQPGNLKFCLTIDFITYWSLIVIISNAYKISLKLFLSTGKTNQTLELWFTSNCQGDRIYLHTMVCLPNALFEWLNQLWRCICLNVSRCISRWSSPIDLR